MILFNVCNILELLKILYQIVETLSSKNEKLRSTLEAIKSKSENVESNLQVKASLGNLKQV